MAAKKKAAKPKAIQRTVKGSKVTVTVKKKGAKKDMKSCTRIDVGLGKVAEVCVHPPSAKKGESKPRAKTPRELSDELRAENEKRWASLETEEQLAAKYSGKIARGRRKARKARKSRRKSGR